MILNYKQFIIEQFDPANFKSHLVSNLGLDYKYINTYIDNNNFNKLKESVAVYFEKVSIRKLKNTVGEYSKIDAALPHIYKMSNRIRECKDIEELGLLIEFIYNKSKTSSIEDDNLKTDIKKLRTAQRKLIRLGNFKKAIAKTKKNTKFIIKSLFSILTALILISVYRSQILEFFSTISSMFKRKF